MNKDRADFRLHRDIQVAVRVHGDSQRTEGQLVIPVRSHKGEDVVSRPEIYGDLDLRLPFRLRTQTWGELTLNNEGLLPRNPRDIDGVGVGHGGTFAWVVAEPDLLTKQNQVRL